MSQSKTQVKKRLEYLRSQIVGECISYEEIAELQDYAARFQIHPDDVQLLQWAGVPEFPEEGNPLPHLEEYTRVFHQLPSLTVKVGVGTQWTDSKGRRWEVIENLHFGRWAVRTKDRTRVGEMYTRGIVAAVEMWTNRNFDAVKMETDA